MAVGLLGRPSVDGQEWRSPHPRPPVHYPFGPRSEQYLGVWDTASWLPRAEPHGMPTTKACSWQAPLPFCRGRKSPCGDSTDFIRPQHQHPTPGDQTAPEILTEVCAKHKGDGLTILDLSALFFDGLTQTTSTYAETPTCPKEKEDIKH